MDTSGFGFFNYKDSR